MSEGAEGESGNSGDCPAKGPGRKWIALGLLACLGGLAWETIDPGKIRAGVLILLAAFGARIALSAFASR